MQVLVVGAGVVGLAIARAAAIAGHDVVVAEAASGIGTGVSSRNSEVIRGGMIAFNSPIEWLRPSRGGWEAAVGGSEPQWLSFDAVVNCAGLGAQRLARATESYSSDRVPRLVLAKGNYFGFSGQPVFSRLIYPVPVPGGLGVHVTIDLAGRMRFGPDVEWIE